MLRQRIRSFLGGIIRMSASAQASYLLLATSQDRAVMSIKEPSGAEVSIFCPPLAVMRSAPQEGRRIPPGIMPSHSGSLP